MKITRQLLEEMVKEELNEATLKDWLLGLAAVGTAANIAVGGAALLDRMTEDAVESGVEELQRIEKDQGKEAVEDLRSQSPQGNETINAVWAQYDSLSAEGGYTDEPDPAASWNENKSRLEIIIAEEMQKVLKA
jgi:hypothetical protein